MKTYELWHKTVQKNTTSGLIIGGVKSKKEALLKSGFKNIVRANGGRIKDIQVTELKNKQNRNFSYFIK